MKICTRCDLEYPESAFQVRKASKDGLTASCKDCLRLYEQSRANSPHRVAARLAYFKTDRGIEASNRAKVNFIKRNPEKRSAHVAVGNAIRDRRLVKRGCEICGEDNAHGHHDDYSQPLNVAWLCSAHHSQWHVLLKEIDMEYL